MLRAGLVRQTAAGIYAWLPLGWRVLQKIEQIVREEQDKAGAVEFSLACDLPDAHPEVRQLLAALSASLRPGADGADALDLAGAPDNITAENADLFERLARRAAPDDGYKLSRVVYLLRDGLKGEALTRQISAGIAQDAPAAGGFRLAAARAAELLDVHGCTSGTDAAHRLSYTRRTGIGPYGGGLRAPAFAGFSDEERSSSPQQQLTEVFSAHHYVIPRTTRGVSGE
jgi:hypothetical protein